MEDVSYAERPVKHRTACDACKRMKIRCEWDDEIECNRCRTRQTICTVTAIPKERKKREKKSGPSISTLEDRLKRMEAAMLRLGVDGTDDKCLTEDILNQSQAPDTYSVLQVEKDGTSCYVGGSSSYSVFSPQSLRAIAECTGTDELASLISTLPYLTQNVEGQFEMSDPATWYALAEEDREPLPPRETADIYIDGFFEGFRLQFPLYDEQKFRKRYARSYPVTCSQDTAWYASLNVVFAIGCVLCKWDDYAHTPPSCKPSFFEMAALGNKYFRNASSTFVDLQFGLPSLQAVQAMVGMGFIVQSYPHPYPCYVLAAAAVRMAQSVGLHRNLVNSGLSRAEIEERREVFWLVMIVERSAIARTGLSSAMNEEDIGIDLPAADHDAYGRDGEAPGHFISLRDSASLALIQGRVHNKLYSAKSFTKSRLERLRLVGALDDELERWRNTIPIDFRPGHELRCHDKVIVPLLFLHFRYYDCLITMHRASMHPSGPELNVMAETLDRAINPRVFNSGTICLNGARSVIKLLNNCKRIERNPEVNLLRMAEYYPLSAFIGLFAGSILQNPYSSQVFDDLELMRSVITFMSGFFHDGPDEPDVTSDILKTFNQVHKLAEQHVLRIRQNSKGRKRSMETGFSDGAESNRRATDYSEDYGSPSPPGTPLTPASEIDAARRDMHRASFKSSPSMEPYDEFPPASQPSLDTTHSPDPIRHAATKPPAYIPYTNQSPSQAYTRYPPYHPPNPSINTNLPPHLGTNPSPNQPQPRITTNINTNTNITTNTNISPANPRQPEPRPDFGYAQHAAAYAAAAPVHAANYSMMAGPHHGMHGSAGPGHGMPHGPLEHEDPSWFMPMHMNVPWYYGDQGAPMGGDGL